MENIFGRLKQERFSKSIVFVNPNTRFRQFVQNNSIPLGLMCLMGVCRELSIPYGFIETDAYNMNDTDVISAIRHGKYHYVGIPLISASVSRFFPFLTRIKQETGAQLIVVGPALTADHQWLMESCPAIDYAVVGEGEAVLPQLLLALEKGSPIDTIPGLAYWEDRSVKYTPRSTCLLPAHLLPSPDFSTIDYRQYYLTFNIFTAWPGAMVFASRGCPCQCTFCSSPMKGFKTSLTPVSRVIDWLTILAKQQVKQVSFNDDTLNVNAEWFEELCLSITRQGLNEQMSFRGGFRADLMTRRQVDLARKAGFWQIFFGAESGCQQVLDYYRKGERVEHIANANDMVRAAGLSSYLSFIVGAPIDTVETLLQTANFIRHIEPSYVSFHTLHPFMGTRIARDFIAEKLLSVEQIREFDNANPTTRTLTLSTEELNEMYAFLVNDFISYRNSPVRRIRRQQELRLKGLDDTQISNYLEFDRQETEAMGGNGLPASPVFDENVTDMTWMPDEISLPAPDLRLKPAEWHESEQTLRWSRPAFHLPFFLHTEKNALEVHWASMRPQASVRIALSTSAENISISHNIIKPDWHTETIRLQKAVWGLCG